MTVLTPESRIARTGELLESEVAGEVVALDIANGQCYGLNAVGTRVWRMLGEEVTFGEIIDTLVAEYDVDRATCEAEVSSLLASLRDEGLVRVL